jgi:hypothetical protein
MAKLDMKETACDLIELIKEDHADVFVQFSSFEYACDIHVDAMGNRSPWFYLKGSKINLQEQLYDKFLEVMVQAFEDYVPESLTCPT